VTLAELEQNAVDKKQRSSREWKTVCVGDLCKLVNGDAYRESDWSKSGVPIIRIQNLNDPRKPFNYWAGPLSGRVGVRKGDVLLAWSGTPGTSFGAHIWQGTDGVLNQHIFRIEITSPEVTPAWFVRSVNFSLGKLIRRAHGAVGLAHVTKGEVQGLEIPLPEVLEQERITARLAEQLATVERARAAAQSRLEAAEALPAALMRGVFDEATWPEVELKTALRRIEAGTSVQSLERPPRDGEWGVLKVSAVSWGRFLEDQSKAVPPTYEPRAHEKVRKGDLLISRANTSELAGAVVLVRHEPERRMLSDKTLRLVLREDVATPEYLEYALRTRSARDFIEGNATGTSASMRNISQEVIRAIPILLPAIEEQRRIAADLARRTAEAERVAERARQELAAIEALPAALLRAAFAGGEG
jgi:type I restriction enzyme S subunit